MTQDDIIKGNTLIAKFMGEDISFNYSKTHLPRCQWKYDGIVETAYHENYDWLIPAFFKFCEVAEPIVNIPRTRISFCSDFVAGLWQQKIEVSYKSLIEGIEWYNKCIDSEK
jgi:hypothetical protein